VPLARVRAATVIGTRWPERPGRHRQRRLAPRISGIARLDDVASVHLALEAGSSGGRHRIEITA
jgi:hypothetical protein